MLQQAANHSHGVRARLEDRAGILDGYPSDGYQRLASRLARFSKPVQTGYGIRLLLAPGRENGAEGDVVRRRLVRLAHLIEAVRRAADPFGRGRLWHRGGELGISFVAGRSGSSRLLKNGCN